jgi:hypothetical protein
MTFARGHHGSQSRIGGQPSLVPQSFPWPSRYDTYIGFTLQLACDEIWLPIPGCAFLQLWQPIDLGDDPKPYAIMVPSSAAVNTRGDVLVNPIPEAEADIVLGSPMQDPAELDLRAPHTLESAHLFTSKLGGLDVWAAAPPGGKFLGQLSEGGSGLNFGGTMCSMYLAPSGGIELSLH